jgi:hypothetical protein
MLGGASVPLGGARLGSIGPEGTLPGTGSRSKWPPARNAGTPARGHEQPSRSEADHGNDHDQGDHDEQHRARRPYPNRTRW